MGKTQLFHVLDPAISQRAALEMSFALEQCEGLIAAETDEGIRLEFASRDLAEAFKLTARRVGQQVLELH